MSSTMATRMNNMLEEYLCASIIQSFLPSITPVSNQAPSHSQNFFEALFTDLAYRNYQSTTNNYLPQTQKSSNSTENETRRLREQLRRQDEKIAQLENTMLQQSATIAQLSAAIAQFNVTAAALADKNQQRE